MSNAETNDTLVKKLQGKFIVLDGPDGCGKSTQVKRLARWLEQHQTNPLSVRDPGETTIGEAIREILLGPKHAERDMRCELMLFMASRAQLVAEKIKPALLAGRAVLSDRYVSSSCAYQGAGGLDPKDIIRVADFATGKTWPDLTIILNVSAQQGFERIKTHRSDEALDTMEQRDLDYHQKVREIFLTLPEIYPHPVVVINADGSVDEIHAKILETLRSVDF